MRGLTIQQRLAVLLVLLVALDSSDAANVGRALRRLVTLHCLLQIGRVPAISCIITHLLILFIVHRLFLDSVRVVLVLRITVLLLAVAALSRRQLILLLLCVWVLNRVRIAIIQRWLICLLRLVAPASLAAAVTITTEALITASVAVASTAVAT